MFSRVRNSTIDVWMTSALGNLEKSNHFYQKTYGPVEWPTASRKFFFDILLLLDCWGRSKPCRILKFRWKNFTTSGKKNLWKSGKNRKTNPCSNKDEPIRNFFTNEIFLNFAHGFLTLKRKFPLHSLTAEIQLPVLRPISG